MNSQLKRGLSSLEPNESSLGGSSTVNTCALGPLLSISLCWGSVYMTWILAARTQRRLLFLCFSIQLQYSPAVVLLKTSALGTFIYLSWVFITFLWSQERSCPFCPCRNKVYSVSSGGSSQAQMCF